MSTQSWKMRLMMFEIAHPADPLWAEGRDPARFCLMHSAHFGASWISWWPMMLHCCQATIMAAPRERAVTDWDVSHVRLCFSNADHKVPHWTTESWKWVSADSAFLCCWLRNTICIFWVHWYITVAHGYGIWPRSCDKQEWILKGLNLLQRQHLNV